MTTRGKKTNAPRVAKAKPRASKGRVVSDVALWSGGARIGGGITPQRISQIIRTADGGSIYQLIDLANECRQRDPHLHAVLATNEESIAGLHWRVTPPENARAKDKRAAKWVEEVLRGLDGLHNLIAHLAGAVYYSFAVSEIAWAKRDGRLVPDTFTHVAHRRFGFRVADGRLVFADGGSVFSGTVDLREEYPFRFIYSQPRVTGDVPSREGLCRNLVWMSVMRNWDLADWLKTGELTWKPWRIGTYEKTASEEDRETLETVVRQMTTDFAAVIPASTAMKIEWPGGRASGDSQHAGLCRQLAAEMSKAVLGQTETTESSGSSGYAQAKVHDAVRRDLRESRAQQVASDITRDLIEPMVRLNFGDTVKAPRFEFQTKDEVDLKSFSDALVGLVGAGVRIPAAWVYDQAGIPEPKDDEEILGETNEADDQGGDADKTPSDKVEPPGDAEEQPPAEEEPEGEEPPVAEE